MLSNCENATQKAFSTNHQTVIFSSSYLTPLSLRLNAQTLPREGHRLRLGITGLTASIIVVLFISSRGSSSSSSYPPLLHPLPLLLPPPLQLPSLPLPWLLPLRHLSSCPQRKPQSCQLHILLNEPLPLWRSDLHLPAPVLTSPPHLLKTRVCITHHVSMY